LSVEDALKSLDAVQKAEDQLKTINADIKVNADQVQAELNKQTFTITAKVKVDTSAGGGAPIASPFDSTPFGFSRGGPVPSTAPAATPAGYASGGYVFRKPSWSKVPGTGDSDTVPAMLNAGSFVVKKKASQHYGDAIMSRLVRGFASGGPVSSVLTPGAIASVILGGRLPPGFTGNLGGDPELRAVISEASRVMDPLITSAKTLPRSTTGQNLGDYLAAALQLIRNQRDAATARALLDPIEQAAADIKAILDNAHELDIPAVLGLFAPGERGGAFATSRSSALFNLLSSRLIAGRTDGVHFASGGPSGSDTVPAMVTPGEFIVSEPAVRAVSRRFGSGFLGALNSMRIPKVDLDALFAPPPRPAYFASGGYVGGAPSAGATPSAAGGSRDIHVTINANAGDILSKENVRRFIAPVLEDLMKKSGSSRGLNSR
jgi:hypothetical protein